MLFLLVKRLKLMKMICFKTLMIDFLEILLVSTGNAQFQSAHNFQPINSHLINSHPSQFSPNQFPPESIPIRINSYPINSTFFEHTEYFYTDKYETNILCTPNIFIQLNTN